MSERAGKRLLILETSGRTGSVALASDAAICSLRKLSEGRAHARDLAPAVQEILRERNWEPETIDAVFVSRGPGSYTGLRVGIMSAKTFAYATGCQLFGIDTFQAIARATPTPFDVVEVIADAQQNKIYLQRFRKSSDHQEWEADSPLAIVTVDEWLSQRDPDWVVSGPGFRVLRGRLPNAVLPEWLWDPTCDSVLALGLRRLELKEPDHPFTLEPLYLRASSAEENWQARRST